jgi:hypothetical protein
VRWDDGDGAKENGPASTRTTGFALSLIARLRDEGTAAGLPGRGGPSTVAPAVGRLVAGSPGVRLNCLPPPINKTRDEPESVPSSCKSTFCLMPARFALRHFAARLSCGLGQSRMEHRAMPETPNFIVVAMLLRKTGAHFFAHRSGRRHRAHDG